MATSVDSLSIQITASTKSAKDRVDELCASLGRLATAIDSLDVSKFTVLADAANVLSQSLSGMKGTGVKQVEKMAKAISDISVQASATEPVVEGMDNIAEEATKASTDTEKIVESIKKLDATPLEDVSSSMEKVSASMDRTSAKMSGFKRILAGLKIIVPTDGLVDVNKKIDSLTSKIADLKDKMNYKSSTNADYIDSKEMEKDQKQIQGLINELDRLKLKKQELESHGGFKFGWNTSFSEISKSISTVNRKLDGFVSKLFKTKTASHQSAKGTNEFSLSASKLAKELFRVSKMLKLMITRMALRAVIKEAGEGFKSLALHSEEFNQSMSALINGSKKLAYSFAAMVSPLINALAPALTYIISLITKLLNIINQVFSAFSGKSTYNRSKDFTENWADNIQAANKSAKELKKTVLGFDELNQLQEKTTSGGDTSGNIEDMFETVNIEGRFKDLAQKLKNLAKTLFDPIKKAWAKVGDFVKSNWKFAMDEVGKLAKSVAEDFLEVWQQEKTQRIFENILKIVGYIGQAVGFLARQFRIAWEKAETGKKILENIRDIILIITEHFVNMAKATADWASKLDFSPILTKFNEWLDSLKPVVDNLMGVVEDFYKTVILPLGKWAIEEGGPQLLQVFIDFNNKVDWVGLRDKLKELWKHVEPFMETVGEGLIIFINRVSQALANFLNSPEFEDFLKEIEDWMDSVSPKDVADGLEAIAKAIAAFALTHAVLSGLSAVASFITTIKACGGLLKLAIIISVAYAGLKLGGKIGEWLTGEKSTYENFSWWGNGGFFDTVFGGVDGIDKAVERIRELRKAWYDMGMEGNVWIQLITNGISLWLNPLDWIIDKLERIYELTGFLDPLNVGIELFKQKTSEAGDGLDEFKNKVEKTKDKMDSTKDSANNLGEKFVDTRKKTTSFTEALNGLKDKNEKTTTSFTKAVSDMETKVNKSFDEVFVKYRTTTDEVELETYGLNNTMTGQWQEISKGVDNSTEDIVDSTDKVKKAFDEKEWTFDGIGDGLTKSFKRAKDGIRDIWNSIADKLNGEHEIGGGSFEIRLPKFAGGGFPEDGLFMANHGEMVGQFSNGKTAVANNAQIVEGISAGVYSAVTSAMANYGSSDTPINNTIYVDGEVLARCTTKAQQRQNRRYSPSMG